MIYNEEILTNPYIMIVALLVAIYILKFLVDKLVFVYLHKLFKKTKITSDEKILLAVKPPINLLYIVIYLKLLQLFLGWTALLELPIKTSFAIFIFWTLHRLIVPFTEIIDDFSRKFGTDVSRGITNFIVKAIKVLNFMIAFAVILQSWGYNVTGFVASLGIGGLAFALAAKDTAANFFGSLVIFGDKPFEVGDWIETPDVEGTVEDIGIRSTKVRTFAQALVNVPNANLATSSIVNWSRMGKRRIKMNIGLTYNTSSKTLNLVLNQIRDMLQKHKDIHQETIYIYFTDYNDSSLGLFCYFFTNTTKWGEYLSVKEDINLKIMTIIEDNDTEFAFPTQSIHIETESN